MELYKVLSTCLKFQKCFLQLFQLIGLNSEHCQTILCASLHGKRLNPLYLQHNFHNDNLTGTTSHGGGILVFRNRNLPAKSSASKHHKRKTKRVKQTSFLPDQFEIQVCEKTKTLSIVEKEQCEKDNQQENTITCNAHEKYKNENTTSVFRKTAICSGSGEPFASMTVKRSKKLANEMKEKTQPKGVEQLKVYHQYAEVYAESDENFEEHSSEVTGKQVWVIQDDMPDMKEELYKDLFESRKYNNKSDMSCKRKDSQKFELTCSNQQPVIKRKLYHSKSVGLKCKGSLEGIMEDLEVSLQRVVPTMQQLDKEDNRKKVRFDIDQVAKCTKMTGSENEQNKAFKTLKIALKDKQKTANQHKDRQKEETQQTEKTLNKQRQNAKKATAVLRLYDYWNKEPNPMKRKKLKQICTSKGRVLKVMSCLVCSFFLY